MADAVQRRERRPLVRALRVLVGGAVLADQVLGRTRPLHDRHVILVVDLPVERRGAPELLRAEGIDAEGVRVFLGVERAISASTHAHLPLGRVGGRLDVAVDHHEQLRVDERVDRRLRLGHMAREAEQKQIAPHLFICPPLPAGGLETV